MDPPANNPPKLFPIVVLPLQGNRTRSDGSFCELYSLFHLVRAADGSQLSVWRSWVVGFFLNGHREGVAFCGSK